MSGRVDFTMNFGSGNGGRGTGGDDRRYRIYIFGDFAGASGACSAKPNIVKVDSDTFEPTMAGLKPAVDVQPGLRLAFESMEDFHPDRWLGKVKILADLQVLKRQLLNPVTAARAAENIRRFLPAATVPDQETLPPAGESDDETLLRLLGKLPEKTGGETDVVAQILGPLVAPHVVKTGQAQDRELIQIIDTALAEFVRAILHSPQFQRLEALWRATETLLREETADRHEFFLIDSGATFLNQAAQTTDTPFVEALRQHIRQTDGEPEVLIVADTIFSVGEQAESLLEYCDRLAQACGGRFFAGVDAAYLQEPPDSARHRSESVLLAYPRYLMRLPYGQKTDPIDAFAFEECAAEPDSADLLWGCPAFLVVTAFLRCAEPAQTDALFFSDVPVFSFQRQGEPVLQPGTEVVLSEAQANAVLDRGVLPLLGFYQQQGVGLYGLGC